MERVRGRPEEKRDESLDGCKQGGEHSGEKGWAVGVGHLLTSVLQRMEKVKMFPHRVPFSTWESDFPGHMQGSNESCSAGMQRGCPCHVRVHDILLQGHSHVLVCSGERCNSQRSECAAPDRATGTAATTAWALHHGSSTACFRERFPRRGVSLM